MNKQSQDQNLADTQAKPGSMTQRREAEQEITKHTHVPTVNDVCVLLLPTPSSSTVLYSI